jgi:hypothetical protein
MTDEIITAIGHGQVGRRQGPQTRLTIRLAPCSRIGRQGQADLEGRIDPARHRLSRTGRAASGDRRQGQRAEYLKQDFSRWVHGCILNPGDGRDRLPHPPPGRGLERWPGNKVLVSKVARWRAAAQRGRAVISHKRRSRHLTYRKTAYLELREPATLFIENLGER